MKDTDRTPSQEGQLFFPQLNSVDRSMSLELPFRQRGGSLRLPSIDESTMYGSEGLSSCGSESEFEGISEYSTSGMDLAEEDRETLSSRELILAEEDEKDIERKVKQEFKEEFQKIRAQAQHKQRVIKKRFKSKINMARAALLTARANAEKETIYKLEEDAEKKEAHILQMRSKRKYEILDSAPIERNANELAALRKIRSNLDRARARRRSSIATTIVASRHGKMKLGLGVMDSDLQKLERVEEIQKLVHELQGLGLENSANALVSSLHKKKRSEEQLTSTLRDERKEAKMKATSKKEQEMFRLRLKKIEEKERLERERLQREKEERERLEIERRLRIMEALKRKAFNMSLRKSLTEAKLTTRLSRPYTYSYFNTPKK